MPKYLAYTLAAIVLLMAAIPVHAAEVGKPAPDFTATNIKGNEFKLSDHKGEIVVLEWTNSECPFVKKHYGTNNMQKVQETANAQGVYWVSIVSSGPGLQGNVTKEQAQEIIDNAGASPDSKVLDESGDIGHLYGASTTPHMFVIDKTGTLAYAGAIDDQPTPDPKTVEGAKNYVLAAIDDLEAGKPVETAQTQPYGCGVKYAH